MKPFDTKKDAESELAQNESAYRERQGSRFCPAICDMCRTDCECYNDPYVEGSESSGWTVKPAHCGNAMFKDTGLELWRKFYK